MPVATPGQNQGQVGDTPGPAVSAKRDMLLLLKFIENNCLGFFSDFVTKFIVSNIQIKIIQTNRICLMHYQS
jgi:hypothetical protein